MDESYIEKLDENIFSDDFLSLGCVVLKDETSVMPTWWVKCSHDFNKIELQHLIEEVGLIREHLEDVMAKL